MAALEKVGGRNIFTSMALIGLVIGPLFLHRQMGGRIAFASMAPIGLVSAPLFLLGVNWGAGLLLL